MLKNEFKGFITDLTTDISMKVSVEHTSKTRAILTDNINDVSNNLHKKLDEQNRLLMQLVGDLKEQLSTLEKRNRKLELLSRFVLSGVGAIIILALVMIYI